MPLTHSTVNMPVNCVNRQVYRMYTKWLEMQSMQLNVIFVICSLLVI